jgi:hypothetical protein
VPSARRGELFFFDNQVDATLTCNNCHAGAGFGPGTNGQIIDRGALQAPQDMKVPQLRNLYVKSGFRDTVGAVNKRGFGYTHDGSTDNIFDFLHFPGFNFGSGPAADATRRDVEQFLLCFDTGMAPAVGAQITFDAGNVGDPALAARMDTLEAQADSSCDLVAKGRLAGQPRGWLYVGGGLWKPDKAAQPNLTRAQLLARAGRGSELTVSGVPRGSGQRMGIDRDRDGYLDGDELDAHSDPGDPASTPANVGVATGGATVEGLRRVSPNPFRGSVDVEFTLARGGAVELGVYDLLGREVRALVRGTSFPAGVRHATWDGRDGRGRATGAGVYFVRLRTATGSWTRTVVRMG